MGGGGGRGERGAGAEGRTPARRAIRRGGAIRITAAILAFAASAWATTPQALGAQTGEFGTLRVEVRGGEAGETPSLLGGVSLTLTPIGPGTSVQRTTSSAGAVEFAFVPAGLWELRVERFGFVPVVVDGVEIPQGDRVTLPVVLRTATPPVTAVDRVAFRTLAPAAAAAAAAARASRGTGSRDPVAAALQGPAAGDWGSGPPGFPPRFSRLHLDGTPTASAASFVQGPGADRFALFPDPLVTAVEASIFPANRASANGIGAFVSGSTPLPAAGGWTTRLRAGATLHAAGQESRADLESGVAPEFSLLASGPVAGDSTRLLVGVSGRRVLAPLPSLLVPTPEGSAPAAGQNRLHERDQMSGLVRLDWDLSQAISLSWQTRVALLPEGSAGAEGAGVPRLPSLTGLLLPATSGSDLMSQMRVLFRSEGGNALELRLGLERSSRVFGLAPGTDIGDPLPLALGQLDQGAWVGLPHGGAGEVDRLGVTLAPTGTFRLGDNQFVEAGLVLTVRRHEERLAALPYARSVTGVTGQAPSLREEIRGPVSGSEFTIPRAGLLAQYRWTPTPGARLVAGVRADFESVPFENVGENPAWLAASGIPRTVGDFRSGRLAPEFELQWRPGGTSPVRFVARGAMHHDDAPPWLVAELLREDGRNEVARTLEIGDGSTATTLAPRLSLLGPEFQRPRATVGEIGMDAGLPFGWVLGASLFHHRSDFLPRRRDLNRVPGRGITDQFGRTRFGRIATDGPLVAVIPGSDRRFPEFDQVHALESDGFTRSTGATVSLAWEDPRARLGASYTWSSTTDNAPWDPVGYPVLVDGAPDGGLADPAWREGPAATDIPHRARLTLDAGVPGLSAIRLGGGLTIRSALPFTPGVRDALGQSWTAGWTALEPISLRGENAPTPDAAVVSAWPCLAAAGTSGGTDSPSGARRIERNICRGSMVRELDLRILVDLPFPGGGSGSAGSSGAVALSIEALNLLNEGTILLDPALFRVIPNAPATLSSDGASLFLPVEANPTFGAPLADLSPGRRIRIGLEVRF